MFGRIALLKVACVIVASVAICSAAQAYVLGPGDVSSVNYDAGNAFFVDLGHTVTLDPGTYTATEFSYQFTLSYKDTIPTSGTVQPVLAVKVDDSHYTPIALGSIVTYAGPEAFAAHPFGAASPGSDTIVLTETTTIYGAYSFQAGEAGAPTPIGWQAGVSYSAVGLSAPAPVIGTPMTTGFTSLSRGYDFSITVERVPEPATMALLVSGGIGLLLPRGLRRRRRPSVCECRCEPPGLSRRCGSAGTSPTAR